MNYFFKIKHAEQEEGKIKDNKYPEDNQQAHTNEYSLHTWAKNA